LSEEFLLPAKVHSNKLLTGDGVLNAVDLGSSFITVIQRLNAMLYANKLASSKLGLGCRNFELCFHPNIPKSELSLLN